MILVAIAAEAIALYYQYVVGDDPCVLCVHVRLWTFVFIIAGILGLCLRKDKIGLLCSQLLSLVAAIGFTERSYQVLGVERGFVEGTCSMSLGLPDWFAPDKWLPSVFEARGFCGLTPEIMFGITMGEWLFVMGAIALAVIVFLLGTSLVARD